MDCFSHKDACRMGLNLEYYISVLKEHEFVQNFVHNFLKLFIILRMELLCIELLNLYTATWLDT